MRAVVTGANGFVGANLIRRLLADGHSVHALVRPGTAPWRLTQVANDIKIYDADVRNREAVAAAFADARPDWIVHLAAHGGSSWQTDRGAILESNVLGTLNVLEEATSHGVEAFVQVGSSSEYGFADHPSVETDRLEPNSAYAVGKAAATLLCRQMAHSLNLPIVTLRLYSVFGPWEDRRRLIPTLVARAAAGEWPPLVHPAVARDFVFVDDAVEAVRRAIHHASASRGDIFNIGSGVQTTLLQLVTLVQSMLGVTTEPQWGSMPNRRWDAETWVANNRQALRVLQWKPRYSLQEGLASSISWLRENPGAW